MKAASDVLCCRLFHNNIHVAPIQKPCTIFGEVKGFKIGFVIYINLEEWLKTSIANAQHMVWQGSNNQK